MIGDAGGFLPKIDFSRSTIQPGNVLEIFGLEQILAAIASEYTRSNSIEARQSATLRLGRRISAVPPRWTGAGNVAFWGKFGAFMGMKFIFRHLR